MKTSPCLGALSALVLCHLSLLSSRAEDVLWNLTFKDLKPGQALASVPYAVPCAGPQKVSVDAQNTLLGAKSVGSLNDVVAFTKGSNSHYMPSFTLKADAPLNSGIVTVKLDVLVDKLTPAADHPIETLMAFPFINDDGGSTYILMIACSGPTDLILGGAGIAKSKTPLTFKAGTVTHLKAVLDLNQHSLQVFLNDLPMGEAEHDDKKFTSFLGFTVRDGTALGGNNGATFTAGVANLVITHQ